MAGSLNKFLLTRIISNFPQDIKFAFVYGSRVFQQAGNTKSNNMIDFVFVVDDSERWHTENLQRNPDHYSGLSVLGPRRIASIQDYTAAGLYYNTLIKCEKNLIKYGVMNTDTLLRDLNTWESLYISGRLQKPVAIVKREPDDKLYSALRQNLSSAVSAAMLLLPESFTEEELYLAIARLSYQGDFRMIFGENKNKVENIVKPNLNTFRDYYKDTLENQQNLHWNKEHRKYEQNASTTCVIHRLKNLPSALQQQVLKRAEGKSTRDADEVLTRIAQDKTYVKHINGGLKHIVAQSSRNQTIKAIFAAGILKSVKYSWEKLTKMWQGRLQRITS